MQDDQSLLVSEPTAEEIDALSPTVAHIDLANLRHNARKLQARAGEAHLVAVVKADAYGHGAVEVAHALRREGVERFAVATVPEGIALRQAGIDAPIHVFGAPLPESLPYYPRYDLEATIPSLTAIEPLVAAARKAGRFKVHVKVETGMGRLGLTPEEVGKAISQLKASGAAEIIGLWTHFAMADEETESYTAEQTERFAAVVRQYGDEAAFVHLANSAALLRYTETYAPFDRVLVRTGISLYGLLNLPLIAAAADLRPVMQFVSRVTHLKTVPPGTSVSYGRRWHAPTRRIVATVGAGYADGYPRQVSNRAGVGIRGERYGQVGSVCMDMFMVDLGEPGGPGEAVEIGDRVVLFGEGGPAANEVALWADTIPYEITCRVSARVPRLYTNGGGPA